MDNILLRSSENIVVSTFPTSTIVESVGDRIHNTSFSSFSSQIKDTS
jgi:hypothetical protein